MKLSELRTGDIIAYRNPKGFLPKAIRFFMMLWAKIHYKTSLDEYYNHTMMVYDPGNGIEVAEAIGKGFVIQSIWKRHIPLDMFDMIVFRPKVPLNKVEKARLKNKAISLAKGNIEYEVLNLLWWVPYILTNGKVDLSPSNSRKDKKLFWFETAVLLFQAARPFMFKNADKITTVDLQMDDRFEKHMIEIFK